MPEIQRSELRQNQEALFDLIISSPLPETEEALDHENRLLDRLSEALGV